MEYNLLRFFIGTKIVYEKSYEFNETFPMIPRRKDIVWVENDIPLRVKQVQWTFEKNGAVLVEVYCTDAKFEELEGIDKDWV